MKMIKTGFGFQFDSIANFGEVWDISCPKEIQVNFNQDECIGGLGIAIRKGADIDFNEGDQITFEVNSSDSFRAQLESPPTGITKDVVVEKGDNKFIVIVPKACQEVKFFVPARFDRNLNTTFTFSATVERV